MIPFFSTAAAADSSKTVAKTKMSPDKHFTFDNVPLVESGEEGVVIIKNNNGWVSCGTIVKGKRK